MFKELVETVSSATEGQKLRAAITRISQQPGTSAGLALAQLKSCYFALYEIKCTSMEQEARIKYAQNHCILSSHFIVIRETFQQVRVLL